MTTVVFATDSPEGRTALTWAIDNRDADEHLHLVLAADDVPAKPGYVAPARVDDLTAALAHLGDGHTVHQAVSDPAVLALDLADRAKARLVVVGLPPRRPTMKMLAGSHVQHILTYAACPVVCVKRENDDATRVF
jgi:nucleotide-binding universal stress UspA family protein